MVLPPWCWMQHAPLEWNVKVEVLTGPQGGGKSETMRREALQTKGLYLFAAPITALIDEQSAAFFRDNPSLHTVKVYARSGPGGAARRLTDARKTIEALGLKHAVIFTTHATLMAHALEGFEGWHARIDEAPASVQAGRFNIGVMNRRDLKDRFKLITRPGDEWSVVQSRLKSPNWKALERDIGASQIAEFMKQAGQPDRAFVKAQSWDQADDIRWFSMWTPLSLKHFASVQIAGSGYTDSIGFQTAKALYSDILGVTIREIAPARTKQPVITIHYFTRRHEGTTTYWESHEGLRTLAPVQDHLVANLPSDGFWSGNKIVEKVMFGKMRATYIDPLVAGLNKHRNATSCAMIFSSKATDADEPIMDVFGLSKDDIQRAREDEAIAQFVMRGAIRNLDFGGAYNIYLYSEKQAERLRDRLHGIGFTTVELAPLDDVGIMDVTRSQPSQSELTPEDKQAKVAEARARDAERKRAKRKAVATAAGRAPGGKGGRPSKRGPLSD
jgi:hypothetical protein